MNKKKVTTSATPKAKRCGSDTKAKNEKPVETTPAIPKQSIPETVPEINKTAPAQSTVMTETETLNFYIIPFTVVRPGQKIHVTITDGYITARGCRITINN